MKLLEYMGKKLLVQYDIPIQNQVVVSSAGEAKSAAERLRSPLVLKAQVAAGGRGKAGGIKFAADKDEASKLSGKILGMTIKGNIVKKLLITEKAEVKDEWYLSIIPDRISKSPMVIFSPLGGIDIEETAKEDPDKIIKITIDPLIGIKDYVTRYIFSRFGLGDKYFKEFDLILKNLYRLFNGYDATLVEINPLVITDEDRLLALDCKIDIDDSSLFRHPDIYEFRENMDEEILIKEARKFNFLYIPLKSEGDIAVMSNGSGMLMSCIDLITSKGAQVRAALDLGGGATSDRIAEALKIVFKENNTKYLFISIFGGITRCDEVAGGVKLALEEGLDDKNIIIRLEGTNKDKALKILDMVGDRAIYAESISDGVAKLMSRRGRG
jgi:succinyl-CoA synthetase beta subunit